MTQFIRVTDFASFREHARMLIVAGVTPANVSLAEQDSQGSLFESPTPPRSSTTTGKRFSVPRKFVELAQTAAYHRDPSKWNLFYRILWRLVNETPGLLEITTDDDVAKLRQLEKEVRRDAHKMKAFVRFRKLVANGDPNSVITDNSVEETASGGDFEHFVAWHRPDNKIVKLVAPFFSRRFKGMRWTIFTPHESAAWDGHQLSYGKGIAKSEAPGPDELEAAWKTYYGAIFNPARIKIAMMKSEMPVKHWGTLPETELIDELLAAAPDRVDKMLSHVDGLDITSKLVPATSDLADLRTAAINCNGCTLCEAATQTVFGLGPTDATLMIVGEQPGDQEDLAGVPFVGPAGQLLDKLFEAADIAREQVYLTNAVKHFSFVERGKQRLHKKPSSREIAACRPWLDAEIRIVKPKVLVCLGATALSAIAGRQHKLSDIRGVPFSSPACDTTIATWHPASILRVDGQLSAQRRSQLQEDLHLAQSLGYMRPS
ncbi:MAG TPA: uracil-DNA glycosylase [Planctomycetaceae bacterium]|nr:uracil-DNA glycosylase [Planctomycetaceae bacterium]